jgi:hypothetical protein
MLPQEYKFFCQLKKVVACDYLNTLDCKGTCNLAQDFLLNQEMDDSYSNIIDKEFKEETKLMDTGLIRFLAKKKRARERGYIWQ